MRMPPCLPHAPLLQFRIGGLLGLPGYRPTLSDQDRHLPFDEISSYRIRPLIRGTQGFEPVRGARRGAQSSIHKERWASVKAGQSEVDLVLLEGDELQRASLPSSKTGHAECCGSVVEPIAVKSVQFRALRNNNAIVCLNACVDGIATREVLRIDLSRMLPTNPVLAQDNVLPEAAATIKDSLHRDTAS